MGEPDAEIGTEEIQEEFLQCQCVGVLDRLSAVPAEVVEDARKKYRHIHVAMLQTLSDAAALEDRVAQLATYLERIQEQQELIAAVEADGHQDVVEILDKFQEDRDKAGEQATRSADRAEAAGMQLLAMARLRDDLNSKLTEAEEERRAELTPQIKAVRDEIDMLLEYLRAEQFKAQAAQKEVSDVAARLKALQMEIRNLRRLAEEAQHAMTQSEKLPERCRRDADTAVASLMTLRAEEEELASKAKELEAAESSWSQQGKEVMQEQAAATRVGEKLHSSIGQKERGLDEVQKDIEMARLETEKHMAERVTLDLEIEKRSTEAKREAEGLKSEQRMKQVALRRLNKAEGECKAAQDQLPPLGIAHSNMKSQVALLQKQLVAQTQSRAQLQKDLERLLGQVVAEKDLTELQAALVKASLQDVHELDSECAEVKAMVAKRDKIAQEIASQRDAASRQVSQWLARVREALEAAELKDAEVDEMKLQRNTVKLQEKELRGLCVLMSEQMGRYQSVCKSAQACVWDLDEKVKAAQERLQEMCVATETKSTHLQKAERERSTTESTKTLLLNKLAAVKRQQAAALEEADHAGMEAQRLKRAVDEGQDAFRRLQDNKAAARAAKEAVQQVLLGRDDEIVGLYEQSDACQSLMDEGARALSRCDDDIRLLQLEVAELQRKLFATQKTAPDVTTYDRNIAQLKADVFKARREAEQMSVTLEDPKLASDRLRMLPGPLPSKDDLADRMGQIDSKLNTRLNQIAQKDVTLDELQRLIDSLVQKAAVSHDGAFQISVHMNDCQRGLQALTRRMMATVSEMALYQALSLKYSADRDAMRWELAAAKQNVQEGRPPTADADKEFARMERDRAQQAEVRQQAAELRRLKDAGLLGQPLLPTASPRPHAYLPDDGEGLPRPFLAPFAPFKPTFPAAATARRAPPSRGQSPSPTPKEPLVAPVQV